MPRRKVVIASMMHETNTFSPVPTPLEAFRPLSGDAATEEFKETNTQLGGFLDVARRMGADIVVPFAGGAHPSGHVERRAYEDMCDAIVGGIARHIVLCDGDGVTSSDLSLFDYRKRRTPLYPFEQL